MPSKISTIFYIHDSNERLMQEYTVKEIMAVSRISRLRLKILKGGCDMFKGEICSLRRYWLVFYYTFGIWQRFWDLAIIWNFDKGLGFWKRFWVLAIIWDLNKGLGFRQWFGISVMVWDSDDGLGFWQ
ncbi:hypothetical protein GLOIN_2v1846744 [Rhizophagus irregularis DAOM 181602=DAOM 197198]|uniref:Uncharacterized protein n=1 Tax=Rhizophagus irregularis (strain DAOM 181602 / DAOM 197198 / MUCL 43194) TaxID=747089 RepID=A0A2P4P9D0_RHIID|nr:hypothetical protein GLOIN_2v1846744 [Rhizophagus irregularis DAOM 181602=DAOM 197198]POG61985.1 hypothetical protein GLOIN_2v1846744 [Rhizophagus irregularis DAOM 181602=DAOM 197198]GET59560.1 hypothetical protein GLOIN_2v1846744 [Rhizophagus irregularis DAOM 181602=DAOM 197198]|eukprot:XP_025168851.1 hypothetical protein GLOIN_2v1846744 [Rhizophagus irregularis DAOM 181602=DAOM 197198]